MTQETYSDVYNGYYDEISNVYTIDAWRPQPDPFMPNGDEGKVIAIINATTLDVYYLEVEARFSPLAQEAIKERLSILSQEKTNQKYSDAIDVVKEWVNNNQDKVSGNVDILGVITFLSQAIKG